MLSPPATPNTQMAGGAIPAHVAIIMDGNGRWAKQRGLPRTAGHKKGTEVLRHVLDACSELGIGYLTIYAFSNENWKRPATEVFDLMDLLRHYIKKELASLHEKGVRLRIIGDRSKLPGDIHELITHAETLTANNGKLNLTVALSYGARQELVRAARTLMERGIAPTEDALTQALDTHGLPDPDLLIRTGGEQRLSNFLLWQSAYAELYFTPVLWPDFTAGHLREAINEFSKRERRYGNAE